MQNKKLVYNIVLIIICCILVGISLFYDWNQKNSYQMYNTSTLHYVSGTVISIEGENLEKDSTDENRYYGTQDIIVRINEGEFEGQELEITNYLSTTSNIHTEEGMKVIVCADTPENAEPYFTIYNYDRSFSLTVIVVIFVASLLLVGKGKGVKALLSLLFTMVVILGLLIRALYHGGDVFGVTSLVMIVVIAIALLILNGFDKKTILFGTTTTIGILIAGVFCVLSQSLLKVNGYNFSEVESLFLISNSTGLQVKHLLFAGVMISSLGAVMDVGVSIVSALYEVKMANADLSPKELFLSGMNIGKDMIGTMSNTLILAFTGTSLTTMLLLLAFGYQVPQLLNSAFLAMEIVRGLSSTFAVVMTVPVASGISAMFIKTTIK